MKNKLKELRTICEENSFILFCSIIIAFIFFVEIKDIIFSTHDEMNNYLRANGDLMKHVISTAKAQGRFYMLFSLLVAAVPFLVDSFLWYKFCALGAVLLNMFIIWKVVKRRVGISEAFLVILCFLSMYELNAQHNLVIAYPFFLQFPLLFMVLSIEFFLQYLEEKKEWKGWISALLLFGTCMFNEGFLLMIGIYVLIAINKREISLSAIKEILVKIKYPLFAVIVYFIIYVSFRICNPSNYSGNMPDNFDVVGTIKTIIAFAFGQFPLVSYSRIVDKTELIITTESLIKAFVSGLCAYKITLDLSKQPKIQNVPKILIVCAAMMIILPLPHAMTVKYVTWVETGFAYAYTVSYYAFWCIAILLAVMVGMIVKKAKEHKKIISGIGGVIFFGLAFLTQLNNQYYANHFEENADYFSLWFEFVESEQIEKIPDEAMIYCKGYNGVHSSLELDEEYLNYIHDKAINLTTSWEELDFSQNVYYMRFDNVNNIIVFGEINFDYMASEIMLFGKEELMNYSIKLGPNDFRRVVVDGRDCGYYDDVAIVPLNSNKNFSSLITSDVDIRTVEVIKDSIESNRSIYFNYGENCYSMEAGWRWLNNGAHVRIENTSGEDLYLDFTFKINTGAEPADVEVKIGEEKYYLIVGSGLVNFEESIVVPNGGLDITFLTNAPRVDAPNDPRELYMCIRDIALTRKTVSSETEEVYISYGENCYPMESDWRWLNNNAHIRIENDSQEEKIIDFGFRINTGSEPANVEVKIGDASYYMLVGNEIIDFGETIVVPVEGTEIVFCTDAPRVDAPNDSRELYMCIRDIIVEEKKIVIEE